MGWWHRSRVAQGWRGFSRCCGLAESPVRSRWAPSPGLALHRHPGTSALANTGRTRGAAGAQAGATQCSLLLLLLPSTALGKLADAHLQDWRKGCSVPVCSARDAALCPMAQRSGRAGFGRCPSTVLGQRCLHGEKTSSSPLKRAKEEPTGCSKLPPHLLTENLQPRHSGHLCGHARTPAGAQRSALLTPSGCSASSAPEPLIPPCGILPRAPRRPGGCGPATRSSGWAEPRVPALHRALGAEIY